MEFVEKVEESGQWPQQACTIFFESGCQEVATCEYDASKDLESMQWG